jgi:membrane protein YqaA with SNARE-associated domain
MSKIFTAYTKGSFMRNWSVWLNHSFLKIAGTKWSIGILFSGALADAAFLPLPVTTFFLILVLLNNRMMYKYVFFVVLGTLAGAFVGYSFGRFIWMKPNGEFSDIATFIIKSIPGFSAETYEKVHILYLKWDFWILFIATVTPIPYGMFSVASGVFGIDILTFFLTTLICQSIKYIFLGFISLKIGPGISKYIKFDLRPAAVNTTVCIMVVLSLSNIL